MGFIAVYFLFFIYILIIASFYIVKNIHNIHQPKVENLQTITKWVTKKKIFADEIVAISPENYYQLFLKFELGENFPLIFKKNGVFVSDGYISRGNRSKTYTDVLENLKPLDDSYLFSANSFLNQINDSSNDIQTDITCLYLNKLTAGFTDLKGNRQLNFSNNESVDYIVLIPFALYMGSTFQLHDIKKNITAIKKNRKARIYTILVNFDKQSWWDYRWLNKIKLEI